MKVLYVHYIWPEPHSSAAGVRNIQLAQLLHSYGWNILHLSASANHENKALLDPYGESRSIKMNSSTFDDLVQSEKPDIILFDRFVSEEQFGWRVRKALPDCLQIVDTQDLHFLRFARERSIQKNKPVDLHSTLLYRELASLHRADLSLVVSDYEKSLLEEEFQFPEEKLMHLPIFAKQEAKHPPFSERKNFVTLGNFRHSPNFDSIKILLRDIWPSVYSCTGASLHCFGAYPQKDLQSARQPGVHMAGSLQNIADLARYRVLLAPLRFGAGIKGKLLMAMSYGTPTCTTDIGNEGIGGLPTADLAQFSELACKLYQNQNQWTEAQSEGYRVLKQKFASAVYQAALQNRILTIQSQLDTHRKNAIVGSMLQYHLQRSTEYFSRWIEEKEK